jgi:hypothetical protein
VSLGRPRGRGGGPKTCSASCEARVAIGAFDQLRDGAVMVIEVMRNQSAHVDRRVPRASGFRRR